MSPYVEGAFAPSLHHASGPTMLHTKKGGEEVLPDGAQLGVSEPLELHWSSHTWAEIPVGKIGVFRRGEDPAFSAVLAQG